MLDFQWLEDLVKTGAVREEVAGDIYNNCAEIIKHGAMSPEAVVAAIGMMGTGVHMGMKEMKNSHYAGSLFARRAAAVKDHLKGLSEMQSYKDFDKKFAQLVSVAPDVAANLQVARALMLQWKNKTISTQDLERLAQTQAAYHESSPESAGKKSANYAQRVKLAEASGMADMVEMYGALTKMAMILGTGQRKALRQAGKGTPKKLRGLGDTLKQTWDKIMPPLVVGAGLGGVGLAASAVNGHTEKKKLEQSFADAMSNKFSNHEVLNNDIPKSTRIFSMLAHFAPEVAMEPHAANAFIARIHNYNDVGVQISDIKDLSEVARNMRSGKSSGGFLGAVPGAVGLDKQLQMGLDNSNRFDS